MDPVSSRGSTTSGVTSAKAGRPPLPPVEALTFHAGVRMRRSRASGRAAPTEPRGVRVEAQPVRQGRAGSPSRRTGAVSTATGSAIRPKRLGKTPPRVGREEVVHPVVEGREGVDRHLDPDGRGVPHPSGVKLTRTRVMSSSSAGASPVRDSVRVTSSKASQGGRSRPVALRGTSSFLRPAGTAARSRPMSAPHRAPRHRPGPPSAPRRGGSPRRSAGRM